MTVRDLIDTLATFDEDEVVIIGDMAIGWSNIGEIKCAGSQVCIMQDMTRPFSSDN